MSEVGNIASSAVSTLEEVWAVIREYHDEVPQAYMILASGTGEGSRRFSLGHWVGSKWQKRRGEGEAPLGEVLVAGESLKEGAEIVLETLLHEAAHALAFVREIKDTSRQGRWHNVDYKKLAEEVLLTVEKGDKGWDLTTINDGLRTRYAGSLALLETELRHFRLSPEVEEKEEKKKPKVTKITLSCRCKPKGRKVVMVPLDAVAGVVECPLCRGVFWDEGGKLAEWWEEQCEENGGPPVELGPGVEDDVLGGAGAEGSDDEEN